MRSKLYLGLALVLGLLVGIALTSWRALPTEDMIARASCASCHDVHAALEWKDAPFQSQVWVLGDVVTSTYFIVADLFPNRNDTPDTQITLLDLLARYGATDFERVSLESLDGGVVTLQRQFVTEQSLLVPYMESLRFTDENQHKSTWLKGVRWITVEGRATPLTIGGRATSMGRLLMSDRTTVIAEGGEAMFSSPLDGKLYQGNYAHAFMGARLDDLLRDQMPYTKLNARDAQGRTKEIPADQAAGALVSTVDGYPTLVLPRASRGVWVANVREITALR
jgi:hypothetical protein